MGAPGRCSALARQLLWRRSLSTGIYTAQHATAAPDGVPAFVFDIDGVLIRGKHVLPAAKAAMERVRGSALT